MNTTSASARAPVFKLKRRQSITVATGMAIVARLGSPFRLSNLGEQILLRNKFAEVENECKDSDQRREEYNGHSLYQTRG